MRSPAEGAAAWAQGFGASGDKWQAGVEGVTVAPGALAARAKPLWLQNTTAAADKFAANSAAVSREQWVAQTVAVGRPRLGSGAQKGQSKYEAAAAKLYPYIESQVRALPARGDLEANINRSAQFARGMAKFTKS